MNRDMALLFFILIIFVILITGILYFFNRGETNIENEDWVDFIWTVDDFKTFLTVVLVIIVPIGAYIIFKFFNR